MALYEMRTYTLYVGKMAEAQKLYTELGSVRGRCPRPAPSQRTDAFIAEKNDEPGHGG
jgi:hypothetical protein